jgi:AcrR family transcriptional regulator
VRSPASTRVDAATTLLDAAERLIDREGLASLTTRGVAKEADLNPGLVHYYFSSMDELSVAVMNRVSAKLLERQRRIFAGDHPFAEQWRMATRPLRSAAGRRNMKVWAEFAMAAINRPILAATNMAMNIEWHEIIAEALRRECADAGSAVSESSIQALAALDTALLKGLYIEHLQGFRRGHAELLALADRFNQALSKGLIPLEGTLDTGT